MGESSSSVSGELSPDLKEAVASVLTACFTTLGVRDRLLAEQIVLAHEHRACSFLAKADAAAAAAAAIAAASSPPPSTGPSPRGGMAAAPAHPHHHAAAAAAASGAPPPMGVGGEVRGAWAAASKAIDAGRDTYGLVLYGRSAALLAGGSSSWAAVLHSPHDDAIEPVAGAAVTGAGQAGAAKKPQPQAAAAAAPKAKGADAAAPAPAQADTAVAAAAPAAAAVIAAMDGQRAAWRHPLELWGTFELDVADASSPAMNGWRIHQACAWAATGRVAAGLPVYGVGRAVPSDADDDAGGVKGAEKGAGKAAGGAAGGAAVRTRSARSARPDADGGGGEPLKVPVAELFRLPTAAAVAGPSAQEAVKTALSALSWARGLGPAHRSPRLSFLLEGYYDDSLVDALVALGSPSANQIAVGTLLEGEGSPFDDTGAAGGADAALSAAATSSGSPSAAGSRATDDVMYATQAFQGVLSMHVCRGFVRHVLSLVSPAEQESSSRATAGEVGCRVDAAHGTPPLLHRAGAVVLGVTALRAFCTDYARGSSWQSCTAELACAAAVSEGGLVALECLLPPAPHAEGVLCGELFPAVNADLILPTIAWLRDRWISVSALFQCSSLDARAVYCAKSYFAEAALLGCRNGAPHAGAFVR